MLQVRILRLLTTKFGVHPREVAALTPYSAQREEIKRRLESKRLTGIEVKTITESQGMHLDLFKCLKTNLISLQVVSMMWLCCQQ